MLPFPGQDHRVQDPQAEVSHEESLKNVQSQAPLGEALGVRGQQANKLDRTLNSIAT
jgi:hypothetical protein